MLRIYKYYNVDKFIESNGVNATIYTVVSNIQTWGKYKRTMGLNSSVELIYSRKV